MVSIPLMPKPWHELVFLFITLMASGHSSYHLRWDSVRGLSAFSAHRHSGAPGHLP
jgi:hypothetical protein